MKKLFRDRWDKKICGVCGGLAQILKIDPTILRMLAVIVCIFTGFLPCLIVYIIASLTIPLGPRSYVQLSCKKLYRSKKNRKIAGVCGGIAEFIKIDPSLVRIIVIVLMIITGILPVFISYIIGSIIIPIK